MTVRTFTLVATNAQGSAQASASVNVADAPPPPLVTNVVPLNRASLVVFTNHYEMDRYTRFIRHDCWITSAFKYEIRAVNLSIGGIALALKYPEYRLLVGGVERGIFKPAAGAVRGNFDVVLGNETDGPYMLETVPYDAAGAPVVAPSECCVPFWIWIDRNGTAKNHPMVVFQNGSFDWIHPDPGGEPYMWSLAPKATLKTRTVDKTFSYIPTVNADPRNVGFDGVFFGGEPFNTALPMTSLTRVNWAFFGDNDDAQEHRPCITKRGIVVTENKQSYFTSSMFAVTPQHPMLDGPGGVATAQMPTAMLVGHAGNIYQTDTFSFYKIGRDRVKKTICGLRHTGPYPPYWEDCGGEYSRTPSVDQKNMPGVEVVGNWDPSIPPEQRFPWECWGIVCDPRSLLHDTSVPLVPLPPFGNLPPHVKPGPRFFLTCRFGRVLSVQFFINSDGSPTPPPTITVFASGLGDPWGIATDGNGMLFVAERTKHRISKWNMDTGANLGDVLANPLAETGIFGKLGATAVVTDRTWSFPGNPTLGTGYYAPPGAYGKPNLTEPRAQSIVAPEGLAFRNGRVYFASYAQGEVRRVNPDGTGLEVCCRPLMDYNNKTHYLYAAVGDGTMGPDETIFTTTYDSIYGRPRAFLPVPGVAPDGTPLTHSKTWDYVSFNMRTPEGPGGRTIPGTYLTACAVGNGMMAYGSSLPGISAIMQKLPGEAAVDEGAIYRGWAYYRSKGYRLMYGNYGYSHVDGPLPWGENADLDYLLQAAGHSKQ